MQLHALNDIALDDVTRDLLSDVTETANKVNNLRPLPAEIVDQILKDLLGERIYTSNAIEGNTLTLGETLVILRTGYVDNARRREGTEVVNLNNAILYIQDLLKNQQTLLRSEELLNVHQRILVGIQDNYAGRFRSDQVMIRGAKYQPPDHAEVPGLVEGAFASAQNYDGHPLILAAWVHWAITRIHPFYDGNGRVARLCQDWLLLKSRLTCAIFPPEMKHEYLMSLASADDGDFNPLVQLIARRVNTTFDKYLTAIGKDAEVQDWAASLLGEVDARHAERRKSEYLRWQRTMEGLRFAFQRCVASINTTSSRISVDFQPFGTIDQTNWENLLSGLSVSKNWFFKLTFHQERRQIAYVFFFGKHFVTDLDTAIERSEKRVCLLVSESVGREHFERLDEDTESPITLREVFSVKKDLVRRRIDQATRNVIYDRAIDPTKVAQDFIGEVILGRLS